LPLEASYHAPRPALRPAQPRNSVPRRRRTRPAAPGDRSSNGVDVTASAERTDGQRDTRARCFDRQRRETGGTELSEKSVVGCVWEAEGRQTHVRAGASIVLAAAVSQSPQHDRISPVNDAPGAPV